MFGEGVLLGREGVVIVATFIFSHLVFLCFSECNAQVNLRTRTCTCNLHLP